MANEEQLAILKQGAKVWNAWRENITDVPIDLGPVKLPGEELSGVDFTECDLSKADFTDSILTGARLARTVFSRANLTRANLSRAQLSGARLVDANLEGANLARADLSATDFSGANLVRADISETRLTMAILGRANLAGANLAVSDLTMADLQGADLTHANLTRATLLETQLMRANLHGTDLALTLFARTNLNASDLTRATLNGTIFGDVDLSQATGLVSARHMGPSTIGADTLFKSRGGIPEVFLRGAGIEEKLINYIATLKGESVAFHSAFISYSNEDQHFAERLHADLQARGVRVWFAPESLKIGDKFRPQIDEAIRVYDRLMVVLSKNSINSAWVEEEVESALEKEKVQGRTVLFPIRLDDAVMSASQAWAASIRRKRHIGDFRKWKSHDEYQKSFSRLLHDLQVDAIKPM